MPYNLILFLNNLKYKFLFISHHSHVILKIIYNNIDFIFNKIDFYLSIIIFFYLINFLHK